MTFLPLGASVFQSTPPRTHSVSGHEVGVERSEETWSERFKPFFSSSVSSLAKVALEPTLRFCWSNYRRFKYRPRQWLSAETTLEPSFFLYYDFSSDLLTFYSNGYKQNPFKPWSSG